MVRRGRGAARRSGNTVTRAQFNSLRNELLGHKIVPSANPPAFIERPWNTFIFQKTDVTTGNFVPDVILVSEVVQKIRDTYNINPLGPGEIGNEISIKIQEARVWCTASGLTLPDLETTFYELSFNGVQSPRHTQRDIGTLNMPAKLGYGFPTVDSKEILGSADLTKLILTNIATFAGSNVTTRIHVLWRSSS